MHAQQRWPSLLGRTAVAAKTLSLCRYGLEEGTLVKVSCLGSGSESKLGGAAETLEAAEGQERAEEVALAASAETQAVEVTTHCPPRLANSSASCCKDLAFLRTRQAASTFVSEDSVLASHSFKASRAIDRIRSLR